MQEKIFNIRDFLKEIFADFSAHKIPKLSASLAYYTVFALPPLIIVLITLIGIFLGDSAIEGEIFSHLNVLIGDTAAYQVQEVIINISLSDETKLATLIGSIVFFIGATSVFVELQESLNTILRIKPKPKKGFIRMIINRLISFLIILIIGGLITGSIIVQALMFFLSEKIGVLFPEFSLYLFNFLNFVITFLVMVILFASIFKILPDAKIHWKDAFIGSLITTIMFIIGKYAIAYYLGYSSWTSAYGAAGSVIILLMWVYYSSLILFIGAEFTQVYARKFGFKIIPAKYATLINTVEVEVS